VQWGPFLNCIFWYVRTRVRRVCLSAVPAVSACLCRASKRQEGVGQESELLGLGLHLRRWV
jgi:hypothetical protein